MTREGLEEFLNFWANIKNHMEYEDIKVDRVTEEGVTILRDAPLIAYLIGENITYEETSDHQYFWASFKHCGTTFRSIVSREEMIEVLKAQEADE